MAPLYLLTALSCAAIAWQPYQRTDLWEWMVWAARSAPYQKGDEEKDEITRIVMAVIFAVPALLSLFASVYLFSHR